MKIKKLNSRGFSHDVLVVLFVVIFAIAGVAYLVGTHADSPSGSSTSLDGHATSPLSFSTSVSTVTSGNNNYALTTGSNGYVYYSKFVPNNNLMSSLTYLYQGGAVNNYSPQTKLAPSVLDLHQAASSTQPDTLGLFINTGNGIKYEFIRVNQNGSLTPNNNWQSLSGNTTNAAATVSADNDSYHYTFTTGSNGYVYYSKFVPNSNLMSPLAPLYLGGAAYNYPPTSSLTPTVVDLHKAASSTQPDTLGLFINTGNGIKYELVRVNQEGSLTSTNNWQSLSGSATAVAAGALSADNDTYQYALTTGSNGYVYYSKFVPNNNLMSSLTYLYQGGAVNNYSPQTKLAPSVLDLHQAASSTQPDTLGLFINTGNGIKYEFIRVNQNGSLTPNNNWQSLQ